MDESGTLIFTGSKSRLIVIALALLVFALVVFLLMFPDVQACAARQPCDLSSCLGFLSGFGVLYGALYFAIAAWRGLPRLELSPRHIVFASGAKLHTVPWGDVADIRRTGKFIYFDYRDGGRPALFAVTPKFLTHPAGCAEALQDHIERYFSPAAAAPSESLPPAPPPAPAASFIRDFFLVLVLEYGILTGGGLLVLALIAGLKAATGAAPKSALVLLEMICMISAMQIGTFLARRWRPGRPALTAGTLLYLLICLSGLFMLQPNLIVAIVPAMLVLSVPIGLFLGFRQGGKIFTPVSK